jgi:hypothetical protein
MISQEFEHFSPSPPLGSMGIPSISVFLGFSQPLSLIGSPTHGKKCPLIGSHMYAWMLQKFRSAGILPVLWHVKTKKPLYHQCHDGVATCILLFVSQLDRKTIFWEGSLLFIVFLSLFFYPHYWEQWKQPQPPGSNFYNCSDKPNVLLFCKLSITLFFMLCVNWCIELKNKEGHDIFSCYLKVTRYY